MAIAVVILVTAAGGNSDIIEANQNEAHGVTGGAGQELATHTDESMYSYPVVDPADLSIEAKRNDAYAVSIVTKKNEAYKPISIATSGTTDEYDYI